MDSILFEILSKIKEENKHKWHNFNPSEPIGLFREVNLLSKKEDFLIIAEMKKASPSKGVIVKNYDPLEIAKTYDENGILAFSILTEKNYFKGSLEDLESVRNYYTSKIILRKDFIIHPYQIKESYEMGADIILLIACLLDEKELKSLYQYADFLGLQVLIEIHNEQELEKVINMDLEQPIIGINNRNLKTLEIDINTSLKLFPLIPKKYKVIAESGISSPSEIVELKKMGFYGALIGHSILEATNRQVFLKELKEASL